MQVQCTSKQPTRDQSFFVLLKKLYRNEKETSRLALHTPPHSTYSHSLYEYLYIYNVYIYIYIYEYIHICLGEMHSTPTMNVTAFNERNVHDVRSKHDPKHQEV